MKTKLVKNQCFYLIFIVGCLAAWLIFFFTHGKGLVGYFSNDWTDSGMDYFNMLALLKEKDPYIANANYPAMCFLILKMIYQFVPVAYIKSNSEAAHYLQSFTPAILVGLLILLLCLLIIICSLLYLAKDKPFKQSCALIVCILLSGPMLFLIERGNLLIVAVTGLFLFSALYDSESKKLRLIAYIALSIAISIKLYPALFSLLVLKKNPKEFAFLVILALAITIAPFFAFDGINSIISMINGIFLSSSFEYGLGYNFSLNNMVAIILGFFGIRYGGTSSIISLIALVICLSLFLLSKEKWVQFFALGLGCVWVPSFSYTYSLTMLLPAIAFFLLDNVNESPDANCKAVLLALLIIPYALPRVPIINEIWAGAKLPLYGGCLVVNTVLLALLILEITISIRSKLAKHTAIR